MYEKIPRDAKQNRYKMTKKQKDQQISYVIKW